MQYMCYYALFSINYSVRVTSCIMTIIFGVKKNRGKYYLLIPYHHTILYHLYLRNILTYMVVPGGHQEAKYSGGGRKFVKPAKYYDEVLRSTTSKKKFAKYYAKTFA